MSRVVIVTAGTSIATKENSPIRNEVKNITSSTDSIPAFENPSPSSQWARLKRQLHDHLRDIWKSDLPIKDKRLISSAEINSLSELKKRKIINPEDRIILLYSATNLGAFCARCLLEVIQDQNIDGGFGKCELVNKNISELIQKGGMKRVEDLGVNRNTSIFGEKGIKKLVDCVAEILEECEKQNIDVIVNATGGYKPESIFASIVGLIYEKSVYYQHEDSINNLLLPPIPIDLDFLKWNEYQGLLKLLKSLQHYWQGRGLITSLPKGLSDLFNEQNGKLIRNILADILERRWKVKRKQGSFSRYGQGILLTDWIEKDTLQKELRNNIRRWEYIWLGDKIPETVEHARGHTQRLLELAAQLLIPIFHDNKDRNQQRFLSNEELYILISSIWLHDIGHGAFYLEKDGSGKRRDITNLPILVRDLHHWLTWEMLKIDGNGERYGLTGNKLEAVAEVCKYHRFWMPLKKEHVRNCLSQKECKDAPPEQNPLGTGRICNACNKKLSNGKPYGALRKENKNKAYEEGIAAYYESTSCIRKKTPIAMKMPFYEDNSGNIRIQFIAALLRLLDACDVQEERLITYEWRKERQRLTEQEIRRENERRKELARMIQNSYRTDSLPTWFPKINEKILKLINAGTELENLNSSNFNSLYKDKYRKVLKELRGEISEAIRGIWAKLDDNTLSSNRRLWNLLLLWIESANKMIFKIEQTEHFIKHGQIKSVVFIPKEGFGNSNYLFEVRLEVTNENPIQGFLDMICEDIEDEYNKIKSLLNGVTIKLSLL